MNDSRRTPNAQGGEPNPPMTLEHALTQNSPKVAAWNRSVSNANALKLIDVSPGKAEVLVRETVSGAARADLERRLLEHGVLTGATWRRSRIVWVVGPRKVAIWEIGKGLVVEGVGATIVLQGKPLAVSELSAVVSFHDEVDYAIRGITFRLRNGTEVVAVREHDEVAAMEPAYGLDHLLVDGGWITHLGRELAATLGLEHDDQLTGQVTPAPPRMTPDTERLVEGLVESFYRWDEPDRVAARAALADEKEREQKKILELAWLRSGQRGSDPLDVAISKMADFFAGRIEAEAPTTGPMDRLAQPLPEIENGGYVVLEFIAADGGSRLLELRVESASGENKAAELLRRGTNAELVRSLRSPSLATTVIPLIERLTEVVTAPIQAAPPVPPTPAQPSTDVTKPSTKPRARTSGEMTFFASLQRCPGCGERVDELKLELIGSGDAWGFYGPCGHCKKRLAFPFRTFGNPIEGERAYGELGRGHSGIIPPRHFIEEIERLSPGIEVVPSRLPLDAWKKNRDTNDRVNVCLKELAKFIPAGADAIPDELLGPEDLKHRAERPERYLRTWVEALSKHHRQVVEANVADLPRIEALESQASSRRPKGVDFLEREHLVAHEKWVQRGKKGRGRLVLVDALHEGMKLGRGVMLSGARLDRVTFSEAYLEDADLSDADLEGVNFDDARLYGSVLNRARLKSGTFIAADLKQVELEGAAIDGTRFDRALLDHSVWDRARVEAASFKACWFGNASLDGGTFTRCDFSAADFSAPDLRRPPTTRARFEDCDFRGTRWQGRDLSGAHFIRCTFAGATGTPSSVEHLVVEGPDAAEILTMWGVSAR